MTGRGQPEQLGRREEQALVRASRRSRRPPCRTGRGRPRHGRCRPGRPAGWGAGDRGRPAPPGPARRARGPRPPRRCHARPASRVAGPAARGHVQDRGLAHPGWPGHQQRPAAAVVGLVQAGADLVTRLAAADQPRAGLRRADGTAAGRQRREHRGAQLLRGGARRGAELATDGLVEALELPQRRALVALVRPPPGDGEVRLLVGGVGLQDLLPPTGQPQQLQVQQAQRLAGLLRPRLVEVVGQQRPAVQAERLGGPLGGPRSQRGLGLGAVPRGVDDDLGVRARAPRRRCGAPPTRCRRTRAPDGRSERPCAAAAWPPREACRATGGR